MRRINVILLLLLVLSGCGEREPAPATETAPDTLPSSIPYSAPGALPPPRDSSHRAGVVGKPEESINVGVEVYEKEIKISHVELPAGQTTFVLDNKGTQPHVLEISAAHGGRWRTFPAGPGKQASVTMVLAPGLYEAYCPLKHGNQVHRDAGGRIQFVVK